MNYIEIRKAAQLKDTVSFSSDLDIFAHHFPTAPLLPGALSGLLLAESCGGPEWSLKKIKGLRFRKPLTPDLPITISSNLIHKSPTEKLCAGKILSGSDIIADGEFEFASDVLSLANGASSETKRCFWSADQIREFLPHGEPIVLIDELVESTYPSEIQNFLEGENTDNLDQSKLVGTKVHTRSLIKPDNFWLDSNVLPSSVLSELVAQAGALTLAPFFSGAKPQVSLLGCDTEYFALVEAGAMIDTYVELTRAKRLGKMANMIIFKGECYIGKTKIAQINLNAMASF